MSVLVLILTGQIYPLDMTGQQDLEQLRRQMLERNFSSQEADAVLGENLVSYVWGAIGGKRCALIFMSIAFIPTVPFLFGELAALSVEKGIDGFALTDHDTIEGWYQIPVAEKKYGITILPAVEISTEWQNRDVHILGFGIPIHSQSFQKFLKILCDERITRVRKIIQKVNDLGMFLFFEEVKRQSNGSLGRPHVAAAMAEKGYVKDVGEAFAKYLNRGKKCYVPRSHVSPMEAVDEVVQSGGAAVLTTLGLIKLIKF